MYYIGLDLGTSALKGLLVGRGGIVVRSFSAGYPVRYPRQGWSEQDPEDWVAAAVRAIKELSFGAEREIAGVAIGGQMHGAVLLDGSGEVIRPAILWNDGRAEAQTRYLNEVVGEEKLRDLTANIAFSGFTAPKLMWVRDNEPQNFSRVRKVCLPKDYLAYRLTGEFSSDVSDASGTLLFDVKNRRPSEEMCKICSVDPDWLPAAFESCTVVGSVKMLPRAALVAGAGDNAAAAVGTGAVENGDCNISLGTSGTVFIARDECPVSDSAVHNFCHANGKWHLLGCVLSAAGANKWWTEDILRSGDYDLAAASDPGENDVMFLPYLMGERCPHNDADVRGAFIGLGASTTPADMCLAVLEGVSFALRDCVERMGEGKKLRLATVCGGGAKSALWKRILASVLGVTLVSPETEQGPAFGAAILAMVGCGELSGVADAKKLVRLGSATDPDPALVEKYNVAYSRYTRLYPALKELSRASR